MKNAVGSIAISGLNVKQAAHLIDDSHLQESVNGWTYEDGAWCVAKRPEQIYSGSSIVAYEAGRMNGADHHVWIDGTTLYDNGNSVGTVTGADSSTDIIAANDQFFIVAATKNYVYDGAVLRELGSWQVDLSSDSGMYGFTPNSYSITDATAASPCVVTIGAHSFSVGDTVYITGVTGMTQLNGNNYDVTAVGATTITLDCDASNFDSYSASGTAYENACGIAGDYQFWVVGTITLADGTVIMGKPAPVGDSDEFSGVEFVGLEPKVYTLAATDGLWFSMLANIDFDCSGTIGTDWSPGIRLYRTKANGYDSYLEASWEYGDADFNYSAGGGSPYVQLPDGSGYPIHIRDRDLGAALDYEYTEHTNSPQSEVLAFAGQRAWTASGNTLYWSTLDGPEYFSLTGNTTMLDTITALGSWRDYCIVFSADRMWAVRVVSGIPAVESIATPAGTTYPKAVRDTNLGLAFLRGDGLYLYNGGQPDKISRYGFDEIYQPQAVVQAEDVIYVSGSETAYVAINRGDNWVWHQSEHNLPYASQTSGTLYGANAYSVRSLFTGARNEGRLKTKKWGGFDTEATYKVELDFAGDTVPTIWVNGNVVSDIKEHQVTIPYSYPDRRILWAYIPRLQNNYVEVDFETLGNGTLYGVRLFKE